MQEIKDEDRIIAKILRGELSFSSSDIVDLEKADLTEEREEQLSKLAKEITETVEKNKELRKEVADKAKVVESNSLIKFDLWCIEDELSSLRKDLKNKKSRFKILASGAVAIFILTFGLIEIVSLFTNSLIWLLLTSLGVVHLGMIPTVVLAEKSEKDREKIRDKIAKLEQERLKDLDYKPENMPESDIEKTKNIAKHIYTSKEIVITEDELKNIL